MDDKDIDLIGLLHDRESDVLNQEALRKYRSLKNRRGRTRPARVPSKLTRTSAFVPRRQGLITDRKFSRTYEVPGGSVCTVTGGELGTQHRDVVVAIFRHPAERGTMTNPQYNPKSKHYLDLQKEVPVYFVKTTWRGMIESMENKPHQNNLRTLLDLFHDLQAVSICMEEGSLDEVLAARERGELAGRGVSSSVIYKVEWSGKDLDDTLTVIYGDYVRHAIDSHYLVSLNAEVQFKLKNDHAKTFWPYIDSQPNNHFIDEDLLAALAGRSLHSEEETSKTRNNFRVTCRKAFDDMIAAGGLASYKEEVIGKGRNKSRRYYYKHALQRQIEIDLDDDL